MKFFKIFLTQGKETILDFEDFIIQSQFKWSAAKAKHTWYAIRVVNKKSFLLHREILNPSKDQMIDHINGDGLDNRRANIRVCSAAQNTFNKKPKSKFKGVTYAHKVGKWVAKIGHNKKYYYIGAYKAQEDAARAYDKKAKELFGEFAKVNIYE